MDLAQNWQAVAYNPSTDSQNQIHSDEMAKAYGFKGGLVPGVTVSSYLLHPAVITWGQSWLESGHAKVVVHKPLYDGFQFEVKLDNVSKDAYSASLIDEEGTFCASATVNLNSNFSAPPILLKHKILVKDQDVPAATREAMENLKHIGMHALPARWSQKTNMASYLKDKNAMPSIHNARQSGGAFANASFMLGLTNWVLAGNAYMNPWIHLQTESQFYCVVEDNTDLIVECAIESLYNKKGHEFLDLNVNVFFKESSKCAMSAQLRAIYKLREIS